MVVTATIWRPGDTDTSIRKDLQGLSAQNRQDHQRVCVCVCVLPYSTPICSLVSPRFTREGTLKNSNTTGAQNSCVCICVCACMWECVCVCVCRASQVRDRRSLQGGQQASCPQQAVLHHSQALQQLLPAHRLQVRNSPPPPSSAQVSLRWWAGFLSSDLTCSLVDLRRREPGSAPVRAAGGGTTAGKQSPPPPDWARASARPGQPRLPPGPSPGSR